MSTSPEKGRRWKLEGLAAVTWLVGIVTALALALLIVYSVYGIWVAVSKN